MEDYKQKYKDALSWMKDLYPTFEGATKEDAEHYFPELKESEEERIRKELIKQVVYIIPNDDEVDSEGNVLPTYQKRIDKYIAWLEKQGEQKPTAKLESKFKVGDWVTNGIDFTFKVMLIKDDMYYRDDDYFIDIETADKTFRLWTIQDAKKGDILYEQETKSILLVHERSGNWLQTLCNYWMVKEKLHVEFPYENYGFVQKMSLVPATKEQRDLLFQKMKEAGYEWDTKKKELRKIEQNPVDLNSVSIRKLVDTYRNTDEYDEDGNHKGKPVNCMVRAYEQGISDILKTIKQKDVKPAWGEEDMEMIDLLIAIFRVSYPDEVYKANPIHTIDMKSVSSSEIIDWLKHLKERYAWKPSEGQLECLEYAIEKAEKDWSPLTNNRIYLTLKALKEQLEKL